jgi:hypothetical protein
VCQEARDESEKARVEWGLEKAYEEFEKRF